MKTILIAIGLLIVSLITTSQENNYKKIGDFELKASVVLDNVNNLNGGIKTGSSLLALFDLSIDYSFSTGLLRNTSFHAHILKTAGTSSSENYIGDAQVASNIDGCCARFIYELLIKQQTENFSFTAGMHDLNSEFMASDFAGDFINSSFGIAPAVTLNVPVSVFPTTTLGGLLAFDNERFNIKTGFYNLNHYYIDEESFNSKNHFFQHGFLSVTEFAYRIKNNKSTIGEYKIGGYLMQHHEEHYENLTSDYDKTNYGFYFIGDHTIKQFIRGQQIGVFTQLSFAPNTINCASEYYGLGITVRELSSKWLPKQVGLAVGAVKLNYLFNSELVNKEKFETVIELTAQIPVFNYFTIQPDFQYIVNPSGVYQNSYTAIVRLIMDIN